MTFHHKKHIFFDLDHTLWDFDKNSALTFEKIFKLNNLDIDLDSFSTGNCIVKKKLIKRV
jgi:putative hydrolase of the HAD superfamily